MAFVLPSFAVGVIHGFKPLPDDMKYTAIGLTTLGLYANTFAKYENLAKTLTPPQKFGTLVCAVPVIAAFTWFSGKKVGKAIRYVSEASISEASISEASISEASISEASISEQERPSGPQAQA